MKARNRSFDMKIGDGIFFKRIFYYIERIGEGFKQRGNSVEELILLRLK